MPDENRGLRGNARNLAFVSLVSGIAGDLLIWLAFARELLIYPGVAALPLSVAAVIAATRSQKLARQTGDKLGREIADAGLLLGGFAWFASLGIIFLLMTMPRGLK